MISHGFSKAHHDLPLLSGKKIVVLIGTFNRGGCERQGYLLARDLRQRYGLDAQVWALKSDGPYRDEFDAAGIPTKVLNWGQPRFGWVQRCSPVVRELRNGRVDVLLPFTTWPNVVAGLSYRFARVGLCVWGERHCGGERVPGIERIAVTQYRRFVANSSAGVEFLAREMNVPRERISFVPNGVEEPKINIASNWRARLGIGAEQLLVVKVANVTNYKDHQTLLHAWKIVQDRWTGRAKPILAIAGAKCDTFDECRRIVLQSGLDSTVQFLGSIPDVPDLLRACDLTVFSSRNEGMPNGVMECMAHGKAVVASDLPGIRDLVGEATDVLVPPGDANSFAERILEFLRSTERREAVGLANRARIRTEFSVETMTDRQLRIVIDNFAVSGSGFWRRKMDSTVSSQRAAE